MEFSNLSQIAYIIDNRGLGPYKLNYGENKAFLDVFFQKLAGEYSFVETLDLRDAIPGIPNTVDLYDADGQLLHRVYWNDRGVCIPAGLEGCYHLYEPVGHSIPFGDYAELVHDQGVFQK